MLLAFGPDAGGEHVDVRKRMHSVTLGERDRETAAVACPVFGTDQRLEGALSVSGPVQRFTPASVRRITTQLFSAARELTSALGGDAGVFSSASRRGSVR